MTEEPRASEYEKFSPASYLKEYYLDIGQENDFLLHCSAMAFKDFPDGSLDILEVGGGPTIYQLLSSASRAKAILFTDYSQNNLDEVNKWLRSDPTCFNWDEFVARTLEHEGKKTDKQSVEARKQIVRDRVIKLSRYDLLEDSLLQDDLKKYDMVTAYFCTDAITHSIEEWKAVLGIISQKLRPKGWLILVGVYGSSYWVMGEETFTATNLSEKILKDTMKNMNFDIEMLESIPAESENSHGYEGVFFMKARKK